MESLACAGCAESFPAVVEALHPAHPDSRFALLTSRNDEVIRGYFGFGWEDMGPEVDALLDASYSGPNSAAFVVDGTAHVLLSDPLLTGSGGVTLLSFVQGWAQRDQPLRSVRPR